VNEFIYVLKNPLREYAVGNSVFAERKVHERLSDYRVSNKREFFKIEVEDAVDIRRC